MNPQQFDQLRQRLDRPTSRALSWEQIQGLACPALPEDPEWPAPVSAEQTEALLERLSPKARVLCVLTAASLLEGQWTHLVNTIAELIPQADPLLFRDVLEFVWEAARRSPNVMPVKARQEISQRCQQADLVADQVFALTGDGVPSGVWWFPTHLQRLLRPYVHKPHASHSYGNSGRQAAYFVFDWVSRVRDRVDVGVLAYWWRRCRCRLAFAFIESSEVSGPPLGLSRVDTYAQIQRQLAPRTKRLGEADVLEILHPHTTFDDPSGWFPPEAQAEQAQLDTQDHLQKALSALPRPLHIPALEIALKLVTEPLLAWLEHPEPNTYYWVSALAAIGETEVYKAGYRKWPPDNPGEVFRAVILNLLAEPSQVRPLHDYPGSDKLASWDAIRREFSLLAGHLVDYPLGQPLRRLAGAAAYAFASYAAVRSVPIALVTPYFLASVVDLASTAWEPDSYYGESTYDSRLSFFRTWVNQVRSRFAFADVFEADPSGRDSDLEFRPAISELDEAAD